MSEFIEMLTFVMATFFQDVACGAFPAFFMLCFVIAMLLPGGSGNGGDSDVSVTVIVNK